MSPPELTTAENAPATTGASRLQQALISYRRWNRIGVGMVLGIVPTLMAVHWITERFGLSSALPVFTFLAFFLVFFVLTLRIQFFVCPRCELAFTTRNSRGRRCRHCGLSAYEKTVSADSSEP